MNVRRFDVTGYVLEEIDHKRTAFILYTFRILETLHEELDFSPQ